MKKGFVAVFVVGMMILTSGMTFASWKLIEDTYTVQQGETLDEITDKFIPLNTYAPREHNEFKSGIRELNRSLWERGSEVVPGETIRINYWIEQ